MFKPFETTFAIHGDAVAGVNKETRAQQVLEQVDILKRTMVDGRWELADLLEEVHDNGYVPNFDEYIDQGSFDIGSREARYLIKINRNSRVAGVSRDQLKAVNISKLKEIFTLDPERQADHIKRLVEAAKEMSLETVKGEVRAVKGLDGMPEMTWINWQVTREAKDNVFEPGIERAKREYGDTIDSDGNPKDISDGKAAECVFADYLASPDIMKHEMEQLENEEGPVEA